MTSGLPKWARESYTDPYDYERATARNLPNGKREIASGAFSGNYDSGNPDLMIDNKRTESRSYIVSVDRFGEIEKRAIEEGKLPALFINFAGPGKSLAVVREKDLLSLIWTIEELRGSEENDGR